MDFDYNRKCEKCLERHLTVAFGDWEIKWGCEWYQEYGRR